MPERTVIYTIDIGDSLMRAGVFVDGETREVSTVSTPKAAKDKTGEQVLFETVRSLIQTIAASEPPMQALAVSASGIMTLQSRPGIRDSGPFKDHELFVLAPNVDGLKYVPLVTRLEELGYGVPVHVENDCNAAMRSATEFADAVGFNLGLGLGAAVLRGGQIEHVAGTWSCHEIGHGMRWKLPEDMTRPCHCGNIGCLEAAIGGWAMTERYRTRPEDALEDIYEHMRNDVVEFLPQAIADTVRSTGIKVVVLSGKGSVGYSENSDFLDRMKAATEALVPEMGPIEFQLMQLGEIAELQGVALALLDNKSLSATYTADY